MLNKQRQSGISLTEILVVVAVIAVLMGVSIPAAKQLAASFEQTTGVRHLINAALSNARALAVREQAYAGVRFQEDKDGNTYMVFIQQDSAVSQGVMSNPALKGELNAYGFRAVIGRKPTKLPEGIHVDGATGMTGPSVIFSKAGKLATHKVLTWNKNGFDEGDDNSNDTIFNTPANVDSGRAMFLQDSVPLAQDSLRTITIINTDGVSTTEHISPYTGELIME